MENFNNTILIIKPNDYKIEINDDITRDDIKRSIENMIEKELIIIDKLDLTNTFDDLINKLEIDSSLLESIIISTNVINETKNNICEMIYQSKKNNIKIEYLEKDKNILCSLMSDDVDVHGISIIMNQSVNDDKTCSLINMNIEYLTDIIFKKIFHKGIFINTNGDVKEYIFRESPFEYYDDFNNNNFDVATFSLCSANFICYYWKNKNASDDDPTLKDIINKKATKLVGTQRIYGECLIVQLFSENLYDDLPMELFKKFLDVCGGNLNNRQLTKEEQNKEMVNGKNVPRNKYMILEDRLANMINLCSYCGDAASKFFICSGCYRHKYDAYKCQLKHWNDHKKDCIYNVIKK